MGSNGIGNALVEALQQLGPTDLQSNVCNKRLLVIRSGLRSSMMHVPSSLALFQCIEGTAQGRITNVYDLCEHALLYTTKTVVSTVHQSRAVVTS